MHLRVTKLEFDEKPGSVGSENAEENYDDETGDEADGCETGGEREHAVADDFCYHEDGDEGPGESFVFDLWARRCQPVVEDKLTL